MPPRPDAPAAGDGVKGLLLIVQGAVKMDSLPLSPEEKESLTRGVDQLAGRYARARDGLPAKVFFYKFSSSSLLVLFSRWSSLYIWLDETANLAEAEIAGRKLVSTAHLGGTGRAEAGLSILGRTSLNEAPQAAAKPRRKSGGSGATPARGAEPPPAGPPADSRTSEGGQTDSSSSPPLSFMSWNEATDALEGILTKVLAQAQATRLIDRALKEKHILPNSSFDVRLFRQVGMELMQKVPHKSIRQSLTNEFESLLERLS